MPISKETRDAILRLRPEQSISNTTQQTLSAHMESNPQPTSVGGMSDSTKSMIQALRDYTEQEKIENNAQKRYEEHVRQAEKERQAALERTRQQAMTNFVRNINQGREAHNAVQNILQQNQERKNKELALQRFIDTLPRTEISSGNRANAVTETAAKAGNAWNGVSAGLLKGLGAEQMAKVANAAANRIPGLEGVYEPISSGLSKEIQRAQRSTPGVFAFGNMMGNVAQMVALGEAAESIPGISKLPTAAQSAVRSAIARGGASALGEIGDIAVGEITPKKYVADVLVNAGAGAAGGAAANYITGAAGNIITKYPNLRYNPAVRAGIAGLYGGSYSAVGDAAKQLARMLGYNDGQRVTAAQIAQDAVVNAAFGTINFILMGGVQKTLNEGRAASGQSQAVEENYFKGVADEDLDKAHRTLAKQLHPDNGGDPDAFAAMQKEYAYRTSKIANRAYTAYNAAAQAKANGDMGTYEAAAREFKANVENFMTVYSGESATPDMQDAINAIVDVANSGIDADAATAITPIDTPVTQETAPTIPSIKPSVSTKEVPVEDQLAELARQNVDQKEAQRQALYEAGKNQEQNIQPVMDSATMLSEEEKFEALRQGNEDSVKSEIEAIREETQEENVPVVKEQEEETAPNENKPIEKKATNKKPTNKDLVTSANKILNKKFGSSSISFVGEDGRQYITDGSVVVALNDHIGGLKAQNNNNNAENIIKQAFELSHKNSESVSFDYPSVHQAIKSLDAQKIVDLNGINAFSFDGRKLIDFGETAQIVNANILETALRMIQNPTVYFGYSGETPIYIKGENGEAAIMPIKSEQIKNFLYQTTTKQKAKKNTQAEPEQQKRDEYSKLADSLTTLKRVKRDGFKYTINGTNGKFTGEIKRDRDGISENARDTIYTSGVFKTVREVADELAAVARSNKLFKETENETDVLNAGNGRNGNADGSAQGAVVSVGRESAESGAAETGTEGLIGNGSMGSDGNAEPAVSGLQPAGNGEAAESGSGRERVPEPRGDVDRPGSGRDVEESLRNDQDENVQGNLAVDREQHAEGDVESDLTPAARKNVRQGVPESASSTVSERPAKTQVEVESARAADIQPKGTNYVIPAEGLNLPNGEKSRYKANVAAIKTLRTLMADNRMATPEEQEILSKYVGWGGLSNVFDKNKPEWEKEFKQLKELLTESEYNAAMHSTLNAHYTDIGVIRAMYNGLKNMGFTGGRIMEPAAGIGHFAGAMPQDIRVQSLTMVELDEITGNIAKYLYPNADVRVQGFETANLPDNYMDLAISNVPFGNYGITDKSYPKTVTGAIHNYFFAKSLDKVRPGGLVCFITSRYTMDSKDSIVRDYIMQRADLVGAIRLPDSAFKSNAGTEVVTDIIVLKKREPGTKYSGEAFRNSDYYHQNLRIWDTTNEYFQNHPEMVLGEAASTGSMYRGNSLTYTAKPGDLSKQIEEAFTNITAKIDYPKKQSQTEIMRQNRNEIRRADGNSKNGSFVKKDGKLYKNQNGELVNADLTGKTAEIVSASVDMRDTARELLNLQMNNGSDADIKKLRNKLNKAYDAFVNKHGALNSPANRKALGDDPDLPFILALEDYNNDTKTAKKADIFSKNTVSPRKIVEHVDTMADGLAASINDSGTVDVPLIARVTGKTEKQTVKELIDQKLAFKTRDGSLQSAQQYLSGNVRAKLKEAMALAPMDPDFKKNIEELEKVVPKDIEPADISVKPGATWIPPEVYADFAAEMLGTTNNGWRKAIEVTYVPAAGIYKVDYGPGGRYVKGNSYDISEYGTEDKSFVQIFDAALNNKELKVYYPHGKDEKPVLNKKATIAVKEKKNKILQKFQEWMWSNEDRVNTYAPLYNDMFNNSAVPNYDGSKLQIDGLSADISLREHQSSAVQRIIMSGGNTLLAHGTGSGKTLEMAAAAMKLRQIGAVRKPMFVVPKNLLGQWGREFYKYFPAAKILLPGENDFTPKNRKAFANKIATGDWDAIILSYEQFEKVPLSNDGQKGFYQKQIDDIIAAEEAAKEAQGGKSFTVKQLAKKRATLEKKLNEISDVKRDTDNIEFESLGVDSLFVDEAHNFKNLFYTTQLQGVSDLGNQEGAKRAFDLYTKVKYLQGVNGGRGIVFGTATPVMNSVVEMYTMQRYLQGDLLEQKGINNFDAWVNEFGDVQEIQKIKNGGDGYETKTSLARYRNLGELQQMFRGFADVVTNPPGLADKLPKLRTGAPIVVECEPTDVQRAYLKQLGERSEAVRHSRDLREDNVLKIYSDGKKMSYTQRMIDSSLPYEKGGKITKCVSNVLKEYKASKKIKGTQLVFCDTGVVGSMAKEPLPLWQDIKNMLIAGGIPENEIAFAQSGMTDKQKEVMQKKVNDGDTRVLIGSTKTMGTGLNIQKRCYAMHEINAPDRPGDVEQNRGRIVRQGNMNKEVAIYTYITKETFDSRQWDNLKRKGAFIHQAMAGDVAGRTVDGDGDFSMSAAEISAIASGNPLIIEQNEVSTKIGQLEALESEHTKQVSAANRRIAELPRLIAQLQENIKNFETDTAHEPNLNGDNFSLTVGSKAYAKRADAGNAIIAEAKKFFSINDDLKTKKIGTVGTYDLMISNHSDGFLKGEAQYPFTINMESADGTIRSLQNAAVAASTRLENARADLDKNQKELVRYQEIAKQKFEHAEELNKLRNREAEIMEVLNPSNEQVISSPEETAQQSRVSYSKGGSLTNWTAKRVGDTNKSSMPLSDIIRKMEHDFGINITEGHVRGAGVMGQYSKLDKGLRSRIANDLPTVAHELGHWFDDKYRVTNSALTKEMKDELEKALGAGKANYSPKQYITEGMAEYIRQFLQNRETVSIDYPKFTEHFLKMLDPEDLVRLNTFADEVNAYYSLDAGTATSSIRLREDGGKDFRTYGERIRDMSDRMYQAWIDSNYAIKQFDKSVGSRAYTLATNAAYSDAIAGRIISSDLTDPNGQYVGPGLRTALSGINTTNKTEYLSFNEYLVCLHGPEWLDQGMRVFADDRKNSTQWMENRARQLENQYPEFADAAQRVINFVDSFTETWGVNAGLISTEARRAMREKYPNYVPFNRALEKGRPGNAVRKGYANQTSPVKMAKGSGLDIIAPVDNIIDMVVTYVNTAVRNNVALEMRNAALKHGDAIFMEKIPEPKVPKSFDMTGLKEKLREDVDNSMFVTGALNKSGWQEMQMMVDSINDVLTQYSRGKAHGDVITIMVDGKPEFWKVNDPLLLESLTSLNGSKLTGILDAYAITTRFMTSMITGSNPIWSIFSNAPRDLQTLTVYAKNKTTKGYAELARDMASAYINGFNENYKKGASLDPMYSEYLAMGGGHASAYSADRDLAKKFRKDFTKNKTQKTLELLNPLEAVSFISDTIERGPRFATYKACRANGMDPQEAFYEAMDVTVNFRKAGAYSRQVNKAVPFFNANVQGTDKFYRFFAADDITGANRRKASISRLIAWFAACAGIAGIDYALNYGSEKATKEYQRLSNYTKNSYFCIPLGDGKYFTIPKGRELLLPASLFERALERTKGNRQAFEEFHEYATDNLLPAIFADIAQYPINSVKNGGEAAFDELLSGVLGSLGAVGILSNMHANKDFLGRPIESASMAYYDPARRYNNRTSKLAKYIGERFGLSPMMIDYFGNNFLSYPWKVQRALFPVGNEERDLSLGVGNTYLKDNIYSQDLVNWMYDKAEKSSQLANDSDEIEKQITSKMDSNMTSFYGRFYKLNKDQEGIDSRKARQAVLSMIQGYHDIADLGYPQETEHVFDIVRAAKDTTLLPAVMQPYLKLSKIQYDLTDQQYVDFQETYNGYYWNYANESINLNAPMEEQIATLRSVAKIAKENAINYMLPKVSKYNESGYDAVSPKAKIQFDQQITEARADGSLTDSEIRSVALMMLENGVSSSEAYELYVSQKKDDKYVDDWVSNGHDLGKYLEGYNSMSDAKKIKDGDQKRETVVGYIADYKGSKEEKQILWDLAGYDGGTFNKWNDPSSKEYKKAAEEAKKKAEKAANEKARGVTEETKAVAKEIDNELAEASIEYDNRYTYVVDQVTNKKRTANDAVAWFKSDEKRATSEKFLKWKETGGSDYDYIKTRADLTRFSGKGKQEKIANYIKNQGYDEDRERVIWFDILDYSQKNWNKYFG